MKILKGMPVCENFDCLVLDEEMEAFRPKLIRDGNVWRCPKCKTEYPAHKTAER